MNIPIPPIRLFLSIFLICCLCSCGALVKAKVNRYATVEKGAIPKDFGKDNTTFLFVVHKNSYNKYLKKNIKKFYQGPYALVDLSELESSKYQDTLQYRYVHDFTYKSYRYWSSNETIYGPGGGYGTGRTKCFFVYDRVEDKEYPLQVASSYWSKLQKVYLKNLEAQRVKNQGIVVRN